MSKLLKVNVFFLCMTFGLFMSCNDDDSFKGTNDAEVIGKWTITSSSGDVKINGKPMVDYIMESLGLSKEQAELLVEQFVEEELMSGTIEFMADYSFISVFDGDTETGTWKLISGGKQMLLDEGTENETTFNIRSASSTKMVVTISETEKVDFNEDGEEDTIVYTIELVLSK